MAGEHATAGESAGGQRGDGGSTDGGAWYLVGGVRRREEEQAWVLGDWFPYGGGVVPHGVPTKKEGGEEHPTERGKPYNSCCIPWSISVENRNKECPELAIDRYPRCGHTYMYTTLRPALSLSRSALHLYHLLLTLGSRRSPLLAACVAWWVAHIYMRASTPCRFFIAAILAMTHPRMVVFGGAVGALAVMTALSAAFGYMLPSVLPKTYTHYASAVRVFVCIVVF